VNVAIIGMGRMGAAMARTLAGAGFSLTVHNRTRSKADAVAEQTGATVAGTPREAAAGADVIISTLADDQAVRDSYVGPEGLAFGLESGSVVLEMSTIDPSTLGAVAGAVSEAGATLLDAPVSGSVSLVESGSLTIMVGGDEEAMGRVRPVLDALAARVYHLGAGGNGATMKLAVNGLVHAINQALSEGLVMAERAGVPRDLAYEVFANSAGGAPFVAYKRDAFLNPDEAPVAFSLDLVVKDLELILGLAERVGAPMPQGEANLEWAREAVARGLGDRDMSVLAIALRG
jgi:3-hydroxyisobutyrate dehydrogenase-like beta-hydroxyacid dehydrogenase